MEYWSQELSWRTLGMPQDMIDLMVNLDSGSEEGEEGNPRGGTGQGKEDEAIQAR